MSKSLHWLTVLALVAQFTVGYLLEDSGRGRGRARSGESGRGRGRGGDDDIAFGLQEGDDRLLTVHALLGVAILMPALTRLAWRRFTPLPPWTEALSPLERKVATWTERALYLCLVLIPLTGISLVLVDDDLLPLHVGAQMHRRTIRPRKNR